MEAAPPFMATSAPAAQINQPAPAVQINQPHNSHTEDRKRLPYYNSKAAVATGIIQIFCGAFAIVLEIVFLATMEYLYPEDKVALGIWGGALFIVTGAIGIFSSKKKRGMVIVYFVLSITCSVTALVGLIFAISHIQSYRWSYSAGRGVTMCVSMFSLIVNAIEGLTAIVASSFGCSAKMCCDGQPVIQERVVYMAPPQGPDHVYGGCLFPVASPPAYESNQQVEEKC